MSGKTKALCPACGGTSFRFRWSIDHGKARVRSVCAACGAEGPDAKTTTSEVMTDSTPAVDKAARFWQDGYVLPETSDKVRQKIVADDIKYLYHRVGRLEEQAGRLRKDVNRATLFSALLAGLIAFHVVMSHILS